MKRANRWRCFQEVHILHHWKRAVLLVIPLLFGTMPASPQGVSSDLGIRNSELVTNLQPPTPNPQSPTPDSQSPTPNLQAERPISWKQLFPNIVHDQKPIWLFPTSVARGRHLKPTLGIIFATAGLVALDPHDDPYFRRTSSFDRFNKVFTGNTMAVGTAIVPLSFYAVGLARRDSFAQHTSLLAGEAVADAEILTTVMKNIDRRLRPIDIDPHGDFSHTWFKSHGTLIGGRGSFPSGHTIAAFSVATVFADRYRRRRWVPWVAYGLASLVGFSRITLQAHFPSDVFMGAALGYVISHDVVMQQK